jgi:hypothetical protein
MIAYDQEYFDQEYRYRQDDAQLECLANAASDGFEGREPQCLDDIYYLRSYWQGKLAKIESVLEQCVSMHKSLKDRATDQQNRLNHLGNRLNIVANRVFRDDGEF